MFTSRNSAEFAADASVVVGMVFVQEMGDGRGALACSKALFLDQPGRAHGLERRPLQGEMDRAGRVHPLEPDCFKLGDYH